jgi:hypothetical protein
LLADVTEQLAHGIIAGANTAEAHEKLRRAAAGIFGS